MRTAEERLTEKVWKRGSVSILEADKGFDAKRVRLKVLKNKVIPLIPYRKGSKTRRGICYLEKFRWKVERTISWLKTRYRRISTRRERRVKYWRRFLQFAPIDFWLKFLIKNIY